MKYRDNFFHCQAHLKGVKGGTLNAVLAERVEGHGVCKMPTAAHCVNHSFSHVTVQKALPQECAHFDPSSTHQHCLRFKVVAILCNMVCTIDVIFSYTLR